MENLYERQQNEIVALKSIFCNNIIDLRDEIKEKHHNKKSTINNDLPVLCITLYPQNSQSQVNRQVYVQVDLKIKLPQNYPNELPKITLENEKGLSLDQIKQLHRQLVKRANELLGFEMVYELCQYIQEFLYENNNPPAKSFYEQRLEYEKINMEEDNYLISNNNHLKTNDHLDLKAEIDQAVDMKIKMLNEERKKEKEIEKRERILSNNSRSPLRVRSNSSKNNSESDKDKETSNDLIKQSILHSSAAKIHSLNQSLALVPSLPAQQQTSPAVTFSPIFRPFEIEFFEPQPYKINCIKMINYIPELSFTVYRGIDAGKTQQIYTIYEWKLNLEKNKIFEKKKLDTCHNEMHKFEEEFKRLTKLNNHLLVKYIAYKYFKESNKNLFVIQLCLEYIEGNTLDFFLNKINSFAILDTTLQTYAIQLLDALDLLHSNHLYHRDLKPSCVYIEKNGASLKLSDYCLVKKVNNLNEIVTNEAINLVHGNLKSDMHQLGLLMLSLRLGENVKDYHPAVPTSVPPELRSFISICLRQEKVDCKYLRKHPFILQNIAISENSKHWAISRRHMSIHYDVDDDDLTTFNDYPVQSRLNTEFEVVGVIGQGGFGEVLKVKNKLDSRFYAIKRISMNPNSKQNKQITREIKLLSRLNHENVVRYYSTWVESYEELINVNERRRSISHDHTYSSKNYPKLIRFKSVENDHESSTSTSVSSHDDEDEDEESDYNKTSDDDSDSSRCITWSRKESSKSTATKISSSSDFSTSSSDHSESYNNNIQFNKKNKQNIDMIDSDDSDNDIKNNHRRKFKSTSSKPIDENTDESVIFAENSDDEKISKTSKLTVKINDDSLDKLASAKSRTRNIPPIKTNQRKRKKSLTVEPDLPMPPQRVNRQYLYIQMEYCGGKTLKDLIDNGLYQNQDRVWSLFREILQGLNHIHEQGMIHRDLKPGNVLIDSSGQHAKIGDFGLATTKLLMHKDNSSASTTSNINNNQPNATNHLHANSNNSIINNNSSKLLLSSNANDSTSLSGAVGTALYVAPELLTPASKNKYNYNQKVDIYSLGIMFYEMCFPFSTNMERIHVIQNLRQKEIIINESSPLAEKSKIQISIIKSMLNHDPNQRPTAKDLIIDENIPRKADEIAFDELLQYSFNNKQSTNYKKIFDAIFKQKSTKVEDASFDPTNAKSPNSFRLLQLREHVYNIFLKTFQRHGGYMINNSLLIPYNQYLSEYKKTFKLTDAHGLVVCLPYNHRIPFARYLARSGCTNIKRYHIGKVFSEKLTSNSLHPREHMEASFDIITSTNTDCLPEIELLTVLNDVISSFPELGEQSFKLVVNHSYILNSILTYCGIGESHHKEIYTILSDYNSKLIKSLDTSKENRTKWFKEHLPVDIDRSKIETLLGLLLKYAEMNETDKFFSDLRNLTKTEKNSSKLAKEGLNQLKQIVNFYQSIGLKIPLVLSTSFVLPLISHPYEYSGLMFALLVQKKKKKEEYDIIASGGRYDKLINLFRTTQLQLQCAVGVSFDFDSIISLINEKSKQTWFRNELAVCCIGDNLPPTNSPPVVLTNPINISSSSNANLASLAKSRPSSQKLQKLDSINSQQITTNSNSLLINEIKNRLRLFRQLDTLNKFYNISTHILHEKFATVELADEFCKKYCINSYAYVKDSSSDFTSQIIAGSINSNSGGNSNNSLSVSSSTICIRNELLNGQNMTATESSTSQSNLTSTSPAANSSSPSNFSFLKLRSVLDKGVKLVEKKLNLSDFLMSTNNLINNMTSFNSINFSIYGQLLPFTSSTNLNHSNTNSSSTSSSSSSNGSTLNNFSYFDLLNSSLTAANSYTSNVTFGSSPASVSNTSIISSSSSSLNTTSQLNTIILVEQATRSQSSRKKFESQIIPKISHILNLFNSRTRIELIAIDTPDNVIQVLAKELHLEMNLESFDSSWLQCLEKLNNQRYKRQLVSLRFDEIIKDLRYVKKSKVFILFSLKTHQFKLLVTP